MIVTLASVKGGVGKSTCAIHIAAYLRFLSSTLLVDSDRIRSCVAWNKRGKLPFPVVDENHQAKAMRDTRYEYVVFDTASAQGVPVYDVDDRRAARAWEAFEALGKEITNG